MNHASRAFWEKYRALPPHVRALADKNYRLIEANPRHPSLQFKKVGRFWSARIGIAYRAVGVAVEDGVLWIWIGPHDEYEVIIRS